MRSRLTVLATVLLILAGRATAAITGFQLETIPLAEPRTVNPRDIAVAGDGVIWFTDITFRQIGRIAPDNTITTFRLTDSADPNNEVRPLSIAALPDGRAVFTFYVTNSSGSPLNRGGVGRITATGQLELFPMPTGNACRNDCGITVAPNGNVFYAASQVPLVGKMVPNGTITEIPIPAPGGVFLVDAASDDDNIVYVTDRVGGRIYKIADNQAPVAFTIPGTNTVPYGITDGPGGMWFGASGINSVGRITPAGQVTLTALPAGTAPFNVAGDDGNIMVYAAGNGTNNLIQINSATGATADSAMPAGQRPVAVAYSPTSTAESTKLVVNSTGANGDFSVHRVTIGISAAPQIFTLDKSFDPPGPLREGYGVIVVFKIKNGSASAITAKLSVKDQLPFGLALISLVDDETLCVAPRGELLAYARQDEGAVTIAAGITREFKCGLQITEARLLSNEAELLVDNTPTGVKSNRVTLEGIPPRTIGSPPLSEEQMKFLTGRQ